MDRIEYEFDIIKTKGYSPYFLVVADLLKFARERGILTTVRGSVAGSITTYLLGITNIDPLEYKLPFERFLNPERPSAPDIDMDYADNRRDEVIEYAKQKYGEDKVAQIGTFGTMLARGAVRDVARALGHPYGIGDRIARLIPMGSQGFAMTIDRALKETPELKDMYKKKRKPRKSLIWRNALRDASAMSRSTPPVWLSPPLRSSNFVPLQLDPRGGKIITQYDMHAVEDAGLLKFDFLGIRNLAILENAVHLVRDLEGIHIDIERIPFDDVKTFEMLARGETMGLFQLNGAGMTRYLKDLRPSTIHDINAMVALYRPGPMENIPHYISRKHGKEPIAYLDPRMKSILERSYGVITYQDDVLLIAINLAGYSWLEADKLRKAMGKKIPKIMAEQEEKFVSGCIDGGMSPAKALELWKLIEPFAAYGFNKAHAASYGRVAYQTAYMKANFPALYMTAVLTAEAGDVEKISEIIAECKRMGIPVLPPDVNESFSDFTVVRKRKSKIESVLDFIPSKISVRIFQMRSLQSASGGRFASFANFLERILHRNLNKKSLEALIRSGALDAFGERGQMQGNMDEALAYHKEHSTGNKSQTSLFGQMSDQSTITKFRMKEAAPATQDEKLGWEKELLGLYVSGHPLEKYQERFAKRDTNIKKIKTELREGMMAVIAGIVEEAKEVVTKKGDRMAFMKVADFTDTIEVVVFPKLFVESKGLCVADRCVAIKGKISERNGEKSLVAEGIKEL